MRDICPNCEERVEIHPAFVFCSNQCRVEFESDPPCPWKEEQ